VEQLGIKDIDAYGHVWYGNYLKFFKRGLHLFLSDTALVRRVDHLKYRRSVPWGAEESRIESYLVKRPAPESALVYQRWCVGTEEDNVCAFCLTLVDLQPGCGLTVPIMPPAERLERHGPKLAMAVKNLQTGAVKPLDPAAPIVGRLVVSRHVYADMLTESNMLQLADVMDLFEQSRTETVGGQPGLKALMDRGLAMVVGQIDDLVLAEGATVVGGSDLVCEVTLIREQAGRRCFDFLQRLLRPDGVEVARVLVLMCCVKPEEGSLVVIPDESWQELIVRLST